MLTPEEVEWLSKRLDKIERKQTEMANTLKHLTEKAYRIPWIEQTVSKIRIDQQINTLYIKSINAKIQGDKDGIQERSRSGND